MPGDLIQITLSPEAQRIVQHIQGFSGKMAVAIRRAMNEQNELTVAHIQEAKMSQRGPETLGVITGRLRRSVRPTKAFIAGNTVRSQIGSNVIYMGPHEFGFEGQVNVKSHTRRGGAGDLFKIGDRIVSRIIANREGGKRKPKQISTGITTVRAHSRQMRIKARRPIFRGISDRIDAYSQAISNAITDTWENPSATT